MASEPRQISMAASAIALRGVRLFLSAGRAGTDRRAPPAQTATKSKVKPKPVVIGARPPQKVFDILFKTTKFNKLTEVFTNIASGFQVCKQAPPLFRETISQFLPSFHAIHYCAMPNKKLKEKHLEALYKNTHFTKAELESLYSMYRKLVTAAQSAVPTTAIGHPPKVDGIDQSTFRDVMHNTFDLVTEELILERVWVTWERGPTGGEGALKFEAWVRGLSILLRGAQEERMVFCFNVYDLNADGFITKDEMFVLLRNSLLKQPGDEDPDEGVRDLVELVLRKLDVDKDGRVSMEDYREAVEQEPLLLEAFGQCLPTKRHATTFLKTLTNKV